MSLQLGFVLIAATAAADLAEPSAGTVGWALKYREQDRRLMP